MAENIATEICSALGIDPLTVRAVDIRLRPPGLFAEVTVETVLRSETEAAGRLVTALRRYELRPKEVSGG